MNKEKELHNDSEGFQPIEPNEISKGINEEKLPDFQYTPDPPDTPDIDDE